MPGFEGVGRMLLIVSVIVAVLGLVLVVGGRIPFLGKLSGDILVRKGGISFYFPVVTLLLLSVVLTRIINFALRFIGK